MMDYLQMLKAREQLMSDIISIMDANFELVEYKDEVTKYLCDAVCINFPAK